jgi:hypothetical protein
VHFVIDRGLGSSAWVVQIALKWTSASVMVMLTRAVLLSYTQPQAPSRFKGPDMLSTP